MIAGADCLACWNRSRTRLAPTPTNISTKSEPEIEKNGTPASPATARASNVLPVPGGPNSRTPLGIFAPMAWNRSGSSRKSRISFSSSTASSEPATSAKVTFGSSFDICRALALPKLMRRPPPCMFDKKYKKTPISNTTGSNWNSNVTQIDSCCESVSALTSWSSSCCVNSSE